MFYRVCCAVFLFTIAVLFVGCQNDLKINRELAESYIPKMSKGQIKSVVQFDHKLFYTDSSNFTGKIIVSKNKISGNLFDQFESNFAFRLRVKNWDAKFPKIDTLVASSSEDSKYDTNIMLGKMLDKKNNIGLGYVLREGQISLVEFNKNKCVILLQGKVARFSSAVNQPDLWKPFSGFIVFKNPEFQFEGVSEADIFKK